MGCEYDNLLASSLICSFSGINFSLAVKQSKQSKWHVRSYMIRNLSKISSNYFQLSTTWKYNIFAVIHMIVPMHEVIKNYFIINPLPKRIHRGLALQVCNYIVRRLHAGLHGQDKVTTYSPYYYQLVLI